VRRLFERATNLSVSTKKAKFLFKKYLEYEKANGTAETVQHVMDSALAYVTARS
jgi:rRNA biogenesis protein RRP5